LNEYINTTGVILAGGKSRRMGQDKLSLKVGGTPLLNRVYKTLASCCEDILVVNEGGHALAGARLIPDLRPGRQGPLAGIEAGLLAARYQRIFVAAGDVPFLTSSFVEYLLGLLSEHVPAVVPDFGGETHPLCAAYWQGIRPSVSAALDRNIQSVRKLLEVLPGVRYVGEGELRRFGNPELLLMNVNSPEDLIRAREALRGGVSHGG